ncbi:hypothetical protein [uncultured Flavobacterium sp.]|uniref:hypothetical protein n=1 Tax=uncultured Flavobacterium sp. TaxID=165435 RepID=UPI0029304482|nr:hypothetical protein [uncultured Flavobacterium sp.]
MNINNELISILSLIIAGLAVFFGPLVSIAITKRTLKLNSAIASKNLISPIRQQWINELRNTITELTAKSHHYCLVGTEDRKDKEYYRIIELEMKIRLLINPKEEDHKTLTLLISEMLNNLYKIGSDTELMFWEKHAAVIEISQVILKREWERVKSDI